MDASYEKLKLENQVCFPLYAASRLMTKCYQPMLSELGLTYPQYLVLLVLWEQDQVSVSTIAERLQLQSNTLTPLLKRMEEMELVTRTRSKKDERSVVIDLTEKGKLLREKAISIPEQLSAAVNLTYDEFLQLHGLLYKLLDASELE